MSSQTKEMWRAREGVCWNFSFTAVMVNRSGETAERADFS